MPTNTPEKTTNVSSVKQSFFNNGGEVDHGSHVHVFEVHDDHMHEYAGIELASEGNFKLMMMVATLDKEAAWTLFNNYQNEAPSQENTNSQEAVNSPKI